MQKEYLTVLKEASAEIEEKKSRFIATVRPVSREEDAVSFISGLKAKYWDASHNVYAYYICIGNTLQKFSDDGEPSGTAGLPVLEAVKRLKVQDVAVVVTRYFGGTLLGVAGLARAYGRSASAGIEAAGVARKRLCVEMSIIVGYPFFGKIRTMIETSGYAPGNVIYGQDVEIIFHVPVDEFEKFSNLITEATNARAVINVGGKGYITV